MSRGSVKLTEIRKNEILNACETLYSEKGFKEIRLQEIADATSITRTAMYTYFETKEEIFMALLAREHHRWNKDLKKILDGNTVLTKEELSDLLAKSLEKRFNLLKLMSMNVFQLEDNSRYERVVEYKVGLGGSMKCMRAIAEKFCTWMTEQQIEEFVYAVFPLIFGIYPYSGINDKARKAMEEAGVGYHYYSIYDLSYRGILMLLK